jgi:O-antigen/teichoic acid export membrane protein
MSASNFHVKKRVFVTLLVNIAKIGLGFWAGLLIARYLGPAGYGDFNFLLGSFAAFLSFLDFGTSTAFFTFIAKRPRGRKFYLFYCSWVAIQFFLPIIAIAFIFSDRLCNSIWLNHARDQILLAFLASFATTRLWSVVSYIGESFRKTILVQFFNIAWSVIYIAGIFLLKKIGRMTVSDLLILNAAIYVVLGFILLTFLKKDLPHHEEATFRSLFREFYDYCAPLVVYTIVGFLNSFANVWMLQKYGGAVQQGYFSVGQKFSTICLLATSSILAVFWKEISEAFHQGNRARLRYFFEKTIKVLMFAGACGSCFLVPFSRDIIKFFLGRQYENAWSSFAVLLLYPIHQSLGQITGTFFYATERTKFWAKYGSFVQVVEMITTYFFLAPRTNFIPGMGLAASGLAIRIVLVQFVVVNISYFFISKELKIKWDVLWQVLTVCGLLIVGVMAKGLTDVIMPGRGFILRFAVAAFADASVVVGFVYLFPQCLGMTRDEIRGMVKFLKI